jgi:hypothetical protein
MLKPSCKVTRKYKKSEVKVVAQNKINQFINRSNRILKLLCTKSGECLAFGRKIAEINSYFKGFVGFDYITGFIHPLGKPSANGFIKELEFERDGYRSNAILKSSRNKNADNLVYEYVVGMKFVNRMIQRFPCFIQTYGLYYYNTDEFWNEMQSMLYIRAHRIKQLELQNTIDYSMACSLSEYAAILVQHISGSQAIEDIIKKTTYTDTIKYDLLYILFILYHTLSSLSKQFTHYDLHSGNVMIIEPVPGKYIQYQYHLSADKTISFKCPYIPKIIDYGRSFFDNGNTNSKKVYQKICNTVGCHQCGKGAGFDWLDPNPSFFISSTKKNESHDLRLLNIIHKKIDAIGNKKPTNPTFKQLASIIKKVKYGIGLNDTDKNYGTEENLTNDPTGDDI